MDLLSANDRPGCYPESWYAATAQALPRMPAAKGALRCDVCVIGGGYTGLSAALHLAQRGYDVVLLEAQRVGFGASGRNGGQVGTGQRLDQESLERMQGKAEARALWDMSLEAVALVKSLLRDHGIEAGWRDGIVHAAHRRRHVPELAQEAAHLAQHYGYDKVTPLDRVALQAHVRSPGYHGGVLDMGGGHLHPLRYALGLARAAREAGVRIHEGSRVQGVARGDPVRLRTNGAEVSARFAILAANGYLGGLAPDVARRVMPINNYIVATRPLSAQEMATALPGAAAVADTRFVVNYFRKSGDNRLLFGGGENYGYRFPGDIASFVRRPMEQVFPQLAGVELTHAWGGTLAITMSRLPYLRRLTDTVLSASGYSGHGVAMASLAGKLMAEAVAGQAERFDLMARLPAPPFPGGARLRHPLLVLAMLWYGLRDRL